VFGEGAEPQPCFGKAPRSTSPVAASPNLPVPVAVFQRLPRRGRGSNRPRRRGLDVRGGSTGREPDSVAARDNKGAVRTTWGRSPSPAARLPFTRETWTRQGLPHSRSRAGQRMAIIVVSAAMRVRVSDLALLGDLQRYLRAAECVVERADDHAFDVSVPRAPSDEQAPQFSGKRAGGRGTASSASSLPPVLPREPRYPRSVTGPAPPLACPHCSEPMQLATKRIRKRGLKPGQRVERAGDEQRVRIWVCHRCGIQRRAQEQ
jgi:hypothetical protein